MEAMAIEVREFCDRAQYLTARQIANEIQIWAGFSTARARTICDDVARASLFHELAGRRSLRPKLRQARRELGV